jgi:hypothetical protein
MTVMPCNCISIATCLQQKPTRNGIGDPRTIFCYPQRRAMAWPRVSLGASGTSMRSARKTSWAMENLLSLQQCLVIETQGS